MARQRKMVGVFCEHKIAPKEKFDKRSFRWAHKDAKRGGFNWILIGCPKQRGKSTWNAKTNRCKIGTRAHIVLSPKGNRRRCPKGQKQITKGR